jgi:hypothetical protein
VNAAEEVAAEAEAVEAAVMTIKMSQRSRNWMLLKLKR